MMTRLRHYSGPQGASRAAHSATSADRMWVPMPLPGMRAWLATWGLAVVRGRSMQPTLYDGDRLLVRHGAVPREGALVVVRLPDGVVAVKRATGRRDRLMWTR